MKRRMLLSMFWTRTISDMTGKQVVIQWIDIVSSEVYEIVLGGNLFYLILK